MMTRRQLWTRFRYALGGACVCAVDTGCADNTATSPSLPPENNAARSEPDSSGSPEPDGPPAVSPTIRDLPVVLAHLVGREVAVPIGSGSPLLSAWEAARARVELDAYPFDLLLMRTGLETFTALLGACSHHGCLVSQIASPVFVCPCHGSRFDHHGNVVLGPASAPLQRFRTEYADNVLTVRI